MTTSYTPTQPWHEFLDSLPLSDSERLSYIGWVIGLYGDGLRNLDLVSDGDRNYARYWHEEHGAQLIERWRAERQILTEPSAADWLGL